MNSGPKPKKQGRQFFGLMKVTFVSDDEVTNMGTVEETCQPIWVMLHVSDKSDDDIRHDIEGNM